MKQAIIFIGMMFWFAFTLQSQPSVEVIVSPGTTVTLDAATTLDITNGHLLLKDDYGHSPSFLQKGNLHYTGSGSSQVEQYLTKDVWHIVSSPIQDGENGAYMWMYMYKYDEPTGNFVYLNQPTTQPLNPGQGYFVWAYNNDPNGQWPPSADYALLDGTLNSQNVDLNLPVTYTAPKSGWNLIGNPFPCGLDWNGSSDWNLQNLDASIWIWDPNAGNYKVWNYNSGGTLQSGEIASTQGFWVHATDTTGNSVTSLTLPISQRVHTNNNFYKASSSNVPNQLRLKVQGDSQKNDEVIIGFNINGTTQPNKQLDALYLEGDENAPKLFVSLGGYKYALKQLPDWNQYGTVPVNFKSNVSGAFNITASWIESFSDDVDIWLEDIKTGQWHNLKSNPNYQFEWQINDMPNRFLLHFGINAGNKENFDNEMIKIYAVGKDIYVNIDQKDFTKGECHIFDMTGREIFVKYVGKGRNLLHSNLEDGFYIVTLSSHIGFVSEKVVIK